MPINYDTVEDIDDLVGGYMEAIESEKNSLWQRADIAMQAGKIKKLRELANKTGENYETLKTMSSVAQTYDPPTRVFNLSFEHYKTVSGRENRFVLLEQAEKEKWSVTDLRRKMNEGVVKDPGAKKKGRPAKEIPLVEDVAFVLQKMQEPETPKTYVRPTDSITIDEVIELLNFYYKSPKRWLLRQLTIEDLISLMFIDFNKKVELDREDGFYVMDGSFDEERFVEPVTADVV